MPENHNLLELSQYRNSEQPVISLYLSTERTVRFHLSNIYDKLGVTSRAEAAT